MGAFAGTAAWAALCPPTARAAHSTPPIQPAAALSPAPSSLALFSSASRLFTNLRFAFAPVTSFVAGAFSFGALCAAAAFTHSEWRTEFMRDKVESAARLDHRSGVAALETAANRPSDSPPQETRDGAEQLNLNQIEDSARSCVAVLSAASHTAKRASR